jgi:histidyl-tRNA synthetase
LVEIGTPFKRYHIGTVWRAEKPQKGRFREFMQCDFDTIGTDSNTADIETLLVIHDLMEKIGFSQFTIRVNNRLILNGLLQKLELADRAVDILRSLDKLAKIGRDGVAKEMTERVGLTTEQAERVLGGTALAGAADTVLGQLEPLLAGSEPGLLGVARLRELFAACRTCGIPPERVVLDVSIARGLDYYTGTIYETLLSELPGIGSVCSGGRYDNLAELFTTQPLPGVGASLGLDRLLAAMEELGRIEATSTPAPVLVTLFSGARIGDYLRIGRALRAAGINAEVFPEVRPLGKQLKYASKKGFRAAVIAGDEEFAAGTWQVKDLTTGEQQSVTEPQLAALINRILTGS